MDDDDWTLGQGKKKHGTLAICARPDQKTGTRHRLRANSKLSTVRGGKRNASQLCSSLVFGSTTNPPPPIMLSQPYAPVAASLFFLVSLFSLVFLVRRRAVMYSPVPALAVLALLSGVLAFAPSVHAQQIVRALLGAVLGASVLYLQVLLSSSLYALLPAVILLCATLLSFVTPLIPTYAFVAPTLSLVFTVSTLPFTILLFISKPSTLPRPPMDDFALPLPSPTFSTTSFPSSETHCEKPRQDPYKPGGPLCPPRALLTHCSTIENPTSSWFSSHTDPESQVVPRPQSRFPLSSFLHYRFSPRRIVHVLLLATQLSSIISSAFEIPAVVLSRLPRFISASPSPPLATAVVVAADGRIRPTLVSAFWILQTLFTVFSLFFIVLAYYNYRHQHHDISGTPPLPRCTPLDLNTRTPPRTCCATSPSSSSSASPLTPIHKHKRALPSASSSFFSPRPKRTPLPLSLTTTYPSTYTGDVMVLGSIHHKDDSSDVGEDGGVGEGVPELDSSPSSTSTSTSSMSPTPARLPIPPELRLSPSPARRATLVHPLPALVPSPSSSSHSSSCTVHGPGSSHSVCGPSSHSASGTYHANAYNEMYDTDADMDVLDAMSPYEVSDIDFRDLRDPFASPLRSPTGCRARVSCGGGYPRSYHPFPYPCPQKQREKEKEKQGGRGGYTVPPPRTQSRMSAWGRLQLPLPLPTQMQMRVGCRGGGGSARVRARGKGKGKKDGKRNARVGDGVGKEKEGEGEGEGEKDVDGQVEDDALLAERLLLQLQLGGGGAGGGGGGGGGGEKVVLES